MLTKTRVSGKMDVNRLGQALARPGMDTRTWISLAVVVAFRLDPDEGAFADVTLLPSLEPETVRVGAFYAGPGFGFYAPLEKDDEVVVAFPDGNPDLGGVIIARTWSASDQPSSTAKDGKTDVSIHVKDGTNLRIAVTGAGKVLMGAAGEATKSVARKTDPVDMGTFIHVPNGPLSWIAPFTPPDPPPAPVTITVGSNLTGVIKEGSSKVEASD